MLAAVIYLAPLALLALKLKSGSAAASVPQGSSVLLRFFVVGLFSLLMSKCCVDWLKYRR
jgi:hypothetical protein